MSCPHTETTTIAWLYGEGPEEHLHHVAGCEACGEAVALHERVQASLAGAPALPRAPSVPRRVLPWAAAAAGLLAAGWLAFVGLPQPEASEPDLRDLVALVDPFDLELEGLEAELDLLAFDLELP